MSCGKRHPGGWIVQASEEIWLLFHTELAMFEVRDNQFVSKLRGVRQSTLASRIFRVCSD